MCNRRDNIEKLIYCELSESMQYCTRCYILECDLQGLVAQDCVIASCCTNSYRFL